MASEIVYINKKSNELDVPLFGIDFLGVIDRGTNVIELKPLTLCNLKCKYCFVSAGDYDNNFIVDPNYLIEKVKEIVEVKGNYKIEIHISPYGESLLYPDIFNLIQDLWKIKGVEIVSMQSNGLLLNENIIKKLEGVYLTRINLSLNTLNQELAEYLCDCSSYHINRLLENIDFLLNSKIELLLAPVWFPGTNDKDIEDIIKFVVDLRTHGYADKKIQIGIQKYLLYQTGRKLKNVRPKSWDYFYKQLSKLEKKYKIKLKLGPIDFGIHKRKSILKLDFKRDSLVNLRIVSKGRWNNECIGRIHENLGIKVLLKKPFTFSNELIGKEITARILKANYKDNIITACFPP